MVRNRPRENAHIGMRTEGPAPDIASMAVNLGVAGIGPISDATALERALTQAIAHVDGGQTCVVDVNVARGYSALAESVVLDDRSGTRPTAPIAGGHTGD